MQLALLSQKYTRHHVLALPCAAPDAPVSETLGSDTIPFHQLLSTTLKHDQAAAHLVWSRLSCCSGAITARASSISCMRCACSISSRMGAVWISSRSTHSTFPGLLRQTDQRRHRAAGLGAPLLAAAATAVTTLPKLDQVWGEVTATGYAASCAGLSTCNTPCKLSQSVHDRAGSLFDHDLGQTSSLHAI